MLVSCATERFQAVVSDQLIALDDSPLCFLYSAVGVLSCGDQLADNFLRFLHSHSRLMYQCANALGSSDDLEHLNMDAFWCSEGCVFSHATAVVFNVNGEAFPQSVQPDRI